MAAHLDIINAHGWHEWLCHTNFSFLVGASHPHDLLSTAYAHGYAGIGIADFNGVYGLARAHLARRRLMAGESLDVSTKRASEEKLKLFHGIEFNLLADHDLPIVLQDTIVLYALTHAGYHNLCRLSTYAHRGGKTEANLPLEYLLQHSVEGLVALQPMRGLIRSGDGAKKYAERLRLLKEKFGVQNIFAVVSRHLNPAEDVWISPVMAAAKSSGVACLLAQDAFFHAPSEKDLSDLLHAIRLNRPIDDTVSHMFPNSERCLHAKKSLARLYGDLPIFKSAIEASAELAQRFAFSMDELRYQYPKEMVPDGHTSETFLEEVVWSGARARYGENLPGKIVQTLTNELALIRQLKFADYFLTVWDIVRWAREQNILCQGRGSAANSAVCFVLGVTSVDPALFDLLFERFISVERGDPPDIDVDFEHERREEVIQYIYERYGRGRAAMVANVITFRGKGSLRAVGKAFGIPEKYLGQVSKMMQMRYFRRSGAEKVLTQLQEEDSIPAEILAAIPWDLWGRMAERLKGFPRHLGIHSGGFMLAHMPLDWLVPQEPATMEGRTVVQWCKDDIEGLGFFKIDVLALGMLTAIRKCFTMLKESYGRELTLASIPADDQPTYAMVQRADTVGTFQIESRAQMSMLPRLRPRNFYDLVVEVAIIRPGPIQGGMIHPYLRRRAGDEPITFPDDRLRSILARTLGIPIFQEQVMRIAMAVGDFTPGEANELRKKMGAWSLKGDLGPWLARLATGMKKNGISEEFIQTILSQMKGFADYGFPESHAVSFALLAYASSYLKCHYPAPFFAALLNSQPMGFYSPHALLQAAKRDGVTILPVCVNKSEYDARLEDLAPSGHPPVYGIRLGLRMVNALREGGARELLARRQHLGEWGDIEHFLQSVSIYRSDLTALAAAGAFAALGVSRRASLWLAEAAPFAPFLEDVENETVWAPETSLERMEQDFAATSTTVGPHPVEVIKEEHWCYPLPLDRLVTAERLGNQPAGRQVHIFGMVLVRQAPPSANGMVFLTLEDETGFINLVFTPQVYERLHRLVESQAFLCVQGKVQRQNESHSLMVREILHPVYDRAEVIPLERDADPSLQETTQKVVVHGPKTLTKARNYM